jgi:hypothetical protein
MPSSTRVSTRNGQTRPRRRRKRSSTCLGCLSRTDKAWGNERFDFHVGHYGHFNGELAAEVRCEVYGEDLGQTGWRTAAEQAEIAHYLRLGPDSRVLDIACGPGGRRWRRLVRKAAAPSRNHGRAGKEPSAVALPLPRREACLAANSRARCVHDYESRHKPGPNSGRKPRDRFCVALKPDSSPRNLACRTGAAHSRPSG